MYWRMDGSRYLECPSANSNGSASVRTVLLTSSSTSKTSETHTMSCTWDTGLSDLPSMLSLALEPTLKLLLTLSCVIYLTYHSLSISLSMEKRMQSIQRRHTSTELYRSATCLVVIALAAHPQPSYSAQRAETSTNAERTQRAKAWLARESGTAVVPCSSNVREYDVGRSLRVHI